MAGYFAAFWSTDRPIRRIFYSVCLPIALGLFLICGRFLYLDRSISVLESRGIFRGIARWPSMLWSIGPGLHFCLLGITLVIIFVYRLSYCGASLPLSFASHEPAAQEDRPWESLQFLIWFLVGPLFLAYRLIDVLGFVL